MNKHRIRALIVDDEPKESRHLRRLLSADSEIEVIGACANGRDALTEIQTLRPDLVFLDVVMPRIDGFEMLEKIDKERMPLVIFVTGYDKYATRAFDVHAVDYLLKPFSEARFREAVEQAKYRLHTEQQSEISARTIAVIEERKTEARYLEHLPVQKGDCVLLVKTANIDWIEAQDKYVCLHVGKESHWRREALSSLETRLDRTRFLRIHRRYIVNIDRIVRLDPLFNHEYEVVLRDGTNLQMSRDYRKRLKDLGLVL
jgi:two-component system LytT family response regulator